MKSPLSGSGNVKLLATFDTDQIAIRWKKAYQIGLDPSFTEIDEVSLWECLDSGLYWYEPAEAAGSGELYRQLEKLDWYYMADKWEFDLALSLINPSDKVLEVGVGYGYFLELCRAREINASGVELNPSGAARARSKGFVIHEKDLNELAENANSQKFDLIASFQVLEHVPSPIPVLKGMIANLGDKGRLLISVPNSEIMRRIDPDHRDLLNQPPHHMAHWDERAFKSLESYLPIKLKSVHYEPLAKYHVGWFVSAYLRSYLAFLGRPASRLLVNRYSTYPIAAMMKLGPHKFFRGHSMLVEFIKTA